MISFGIGFVLGAPVWIVVGIVLLDAVTKIRERTAAIHQLIHEEPPHDNYLDGPVPWSEQLDGDEGTELGRWT